MSFGKCTVHITYCYRCCQGTSIGICNCQVIVTCCKCSDIFCCCCKATRSGPCIGQCSCSTCHCNIDRSIAHSTTCSSYYISLSKCVRCLSYCYRNRKYASICIGYCKVISSGNKTCDIFCRSCKATRSGPCIGQCSHSACHCDIHRSIITYASCICCYMSLGKCTVHIT